MRKLSSYSVFKNHKTQLKNTSSDIINKEYLSDDTRIVIDFDAVKEAYMSDISVPTDFASSVDAVFSDDEEKIYFVEFKNGDFEGIKIKKKAYDSILIYQDVVSSKISELRDNGIFILVISDEKYEKLSARDKRAMAFASRGKTDYAIYGLNKLRGYCFKEVHCKKALNFKKYIEQKRIII